MRPRGRGLEAGLVARDDGEPGAGGGQQPVSGGPRPPLAPVTRTERPDGSTGVCVGQGPDVHTARGCPHPGPPPPPRGRRRSVRASGDVGAGRSGLAAKGRGGLRGRARRAAIRRLATRCGARRRDELFAEHPASPAVPRGPGGAGLPVAPTTRAPLRGRAAARRSRDRMEVPTGTDGVVPFARVGVVELPGLGSARRLVAGRRTAAGCSCRCATASAGRPAAPSAAAGTCSTPSRAPTSAATAAALSSTSTSPTTRRAPTTPRGRARSPRAATR